MKQVCNACGNSAIRILRVVGAQSRVECEACRLVFVSPIPTPQQLEAIYGESYFRNPDSGAIGYADYLRDENNIRHTFRERLARLEKWVTPGASLDVGCAAGFFVAEARSRGWAAEGLDVSKFAVRFATKELGVEAQAGSLLDMPGANRYDLVTMWDFIEHVPDPAAHIVAAARLLRPGGVLTVTTPDVGSMPARLLGDRWMGYKHADEHLYYFSAATMKRMLRQAGLEIVDTRYTGKHVTLAMFFNRLSQYSRPLAALLRWPFKMLGMEHSSLYVNPYDILWISARKR